MRYVSVFALLMVLAVPASAHRTDAAKAVLAHSTAEQRATAEIVSARIRAALDGEAYSLDKVCDGENCAVSASH